MARHRRNLWRARVGRLFYVLLVLGAAAFPATRSLPAQAAVSAVKGYACGYFVNVGLFGGPQQLQGCGQPASASPTSAAPSVTLPEGGSADAITANDPDGAAGQYGPAKIFAGRWPADVQSTPPSGPMSVSTRGTPADGTVTSSADIVLNDPKKPVACEPNPTPPVTARPAGQECYAVGGFGPWPAEGDELHVSCNASPSSITGSTKLVHADLATATDAEGNPLAGAVEAIPDDPPVNYTRSGVITNVGDVFTTVYNQQIVNPDGSLTVNALHMYLFGPTAVGEMVKGQATCGVTPSPLSPKDTEAPRCGIPVVEPKSPEDQTPKTPRTELLGLFDTGGLQAVGNPQATNGTVNVGNPEGAPYLQLAPGQTGPLQMTATRTDEGQPMSWSFDATDAAGNTRHIEVADGKSGQCPTDDPPGKPDPDAATAVSTDWPRPRPAAPPPVASTAAPKPAPNSAATTPASPSMTTTQPPDSTTTTTDTTPGELTPPSTGGSAGRAAPRVRKSGSSKALPLALAAGALVLAGGPASVLALRRWRAGQGQSQSLPDRWQW